MWARRDEAGNPRRLPLVIGHRGASAHEIENTVPSFQRAAAEGADGVELDVLACGSGEVVVFHDDDLARLAGRPERIADLSLAQLREIPVGNGGRIPTLEEAFEACGPALLVNVELKAASLASERIATLVEKVAAIVERLGVGERILVSSFHPWAVRRWMRRAPRVRAGFLFEGRSPLNAWAAAWLRPFSLNPEWALCRPDKILRWHRRGAFVSVWTVDDPAALAACRDMGVDAVISNDPARARRLLSAG